MRSQAEEIPNKRRGWSWARLREVGTEVWRHLRAADEGIVGGCASTVNAIAALNGIDPNVAPQVGQLLRIRQGFLDPIE